MLRKPITEACAELGGIGCFTQQGWLPWSTQRVSLPSSVVIDLLSAPQYLAAGSLQGPMVSLATADPISKNGSQSCPEDFDRARLSALQVCMACHKSLNPSNHLAYPKP